MVTVNCVGTGTGCAVMNLIGGQVGQSLVVIVTSLVLCVVIVEGVLDSVAVEPDFVMVVGGQVGQGLYTVVAELDPDIVVIGQVGQGLVIVVETLTAGAEGIWTCGLTDEVWFLKGCGTNGTPVLR